MKRKDFIKWTGLVVVSPLAVLESCKENGDNAATVAVVTTYTCPMHPQIVQTKMGTCPVCGMDLVVFDKNNKEADLTLSKEQQLLANITTVEIGAGSLENSTRLNGRLVVNPSNTIYVTSRVEGRIESLFVKETGALVQKGQVLYRIYSEQLLTLQKEYRLTVAQVKQFPADRRFQEIEAAARQKLLLYGQTPAQVAQVISTEQDNPYVNYYAPATGVVAELTVSEGQYVGEGSPLLRLEDYGQLWVEADLYPGEASTISKGQTVQVVIAGNEATPYPMKVEFMEPALQAGTQLLTVRGTIKNTNLLFQPGMPVQVVLNRGSASELLQLPLAAVIRDGQSAHVWVQAAAEKFEPREVKIGMENTDTIVVLEGLEEGEKVVISGAYLLYSEYILKKGKHPLHS
jgi:Cu(I)/Ag(I) efflux system membrane fusion protein